MTERERIAALEEQIDVLADRLRGIGITAERDVERALAALGKRNRPPVDGQGGMTIDKGVGGEAAKPRGRPPINDEGGTATTKGSGDFLRWEREGWVHHATRMANERDEAQAERDDLADALRQLERLATAVAGDAPTEARYGSLWSDLRRAAAEARKVLDKHDGKTERNES